MTFRILIVDSNTNQRATLCSKLLSKQYTVDFCSSAQAAQSVMKSKAYDLLLLHMGRPDNNPLAFCRWAKGRHPVIVGIGGPDRDSARIAALEAGVEDIFPDPINEVLLLAKISQISRIYGLMDRTITKTVTMRALGFEQPKQADFKARQIFIHGQMPPQILAKVRVAADQIGAKLQVPETGSRYSGPSVSLGVSYLSYDHQINGPAKGPTHQFPKQEVIDQLVLFSPAAEQLAAEYMRKDFDAVPDRVSSAELALRFLRDLTRDTVQRECANTLFTRAQPIDLGQR